MWIKEFGNLLKERRKSLGINQSDLAEIAGISINTLYKIERGQTNATLEVLEKILDVLGLELKLEIRKVG
jgi:y4mF family transcriptional regulator